MIRALFFTLILFAATANGASVTVNGDNVKFTYDDSSLYGTANVIGNTIFFTPTTFTAESLDGAGLVQTSASLAITIEILPASAGLAMNTFQLLENGDYKLNGGGTSVSAVGELTIDSQTSAFSDSNLFNAGALTVPGGPTDWSAGTTINLGDTLGWDMDTSVIMTLDNTLSATSSLSGVGEQAFIQKKFEGDAIGITIDLTASGAVPVPAAVWLFGSALGLLGWLRRRTAA